MASRRNVAQMFGHVGRRTQNLVGRQIALIDRLEREETEPDRLQHLYRLDHVSSRLRRNAGSLVVLSGGAGAERHVAPLPLADVVRLALGEIEDYTRVDVAGAGGHRDGRRPVIGDLVLVLAELMENATTFSPPHTRVTVAAADTASGVRLSDRRPRHRHVRRAAGGGERPADPARAARPRADRGARPVRGRPARPPARDRRRAVRDPGRRRHRDDRDRRAVSGARARPRSTTAAACRARRCTPPPSRPDRGGTAARPVSAGAAAGHPSAAEPSGAGRR